MVWAAIGIAYRSPLIFLEGKVTAETYRAMLHGYRIFESIQQSAESRGVTLPFFQQDGAPAHTAKATMAWLKNKTPLIKNWPPNSPDLSPIEMIWAILKRRLRERQPTNLAEFKQMLREEYSNITQDIIDRMMMGMNGRFRLCIANHGECINRLLTRKRLQEGYIVPSDILQPRDVSIRNIGTAVKLRGRTVSINDAPNEQFPDGADISVSDIETPPGQAPRIITLHVPFREDWDVNAEQFFEAKVTGHVACGRSSWSPPTLGYSFHYIGMIIDPFASSNNDRINETVTNEDYSSEEYEGPQSPYSSQSDDEDPEDMLSLLEESDASQ
jgi:hypothetical protein